MSKTILISVFALFVISAGWGMVETVHHSSHAFAEDTSNENPVKNKIYALAFDDNDLPCYVGGQYVAKCSRNNPYYNAFSGECYATLKDCKKADGDLADAPGSGSCVRCGN
jgi:hypothetical protein